MPPKWICGLGACRDLWRLAAAIYLEEIERAELCDATWHLSPMTPTVFTGSSTARARARRDLDRRHDRRRLPFPDDFLGRVAIRINDVRGINRVVYDVSSKPAGDDRVEMREYRSAEDSIPFLRRARY